MRLIQAFLFLTIGAPLFGAVPSPPLTTLKIGHVDSLTGPEALYGIAVDRGIRLAFEEVNQAGGIRGHKLTLISYDDASRPDNAVTAMTRAIASDEVLAVLGEVASSKSLAMAPLAQMHRVPMITPGATHSKVTQVGNFIFRTCFLDVFQSDAIAAFGIKDLKLKRFAVLRDRGNEYSCSLADRFIAQIKKQGGEIVADASYLGGDIEFRSQLGSLRKLAPQAVFIPGYHNEVGLIARQARESGLNAVLLGGDGWDSQSLLQMAGAELEGSYFINHYYPDAQDARVQKFMKRFAERFKVEPNSSAALGYDAALVLADALNRSTNFTQAELRVALAGTQGVKGITGDISMGPDRNAIKSGVVLGIRGKKFHQVKQVGTHR